MKHPTTLWLAAALTSACALTVTAAPDAADGTQAPDAAPVDDAPRDVARDPLPTLALPIDVHDMAFDRDGALVVGGEWDQREPLAGRAGGRPGDAAGVVVWVDAAMRVSRVLVQPRATAAGSVSPAADGAVWVAWRAFLDGAVGSARVDRVERLSVSGGGGASWSAGAPWEMVAHVRATPDGGAVVAVQDTVPLPADGFATAASLLRLAPDGTPVWRDDLGRGGDRLEETYASALWLDARDGDAWGLYDLFDGRAAVVAHRADGSRLGQASVGEAFETGVGAVARDGRRLVASVERRGAERSVRVVEVSPGAARGRAWPDVAGTRGALAGIRAEATRDGLRLAFWHADVARVGAGATRDAHGVAVVDAPSMGSARVIAELPDCRPRPAHGLVTAAAADGSVVLSCSAGEGRATLRRLPP